MTPTYVTPKGTTLLDSFLPSTVGSLPRRLLIAFLASLAIAVASKIQVPFWPVPMTMQTLVILSISMAFGARMAVLTVLIYLAQGAAGLPVFAGTSEKGIGLAYMMGGTGGYLLGYVLAAGVCGYLAERGWDRSPVSTAFAMLVGNALIYVPGVLWLGILFGWDKPILDWGLWPFLAGDAAKLILVAALLPFLWKLVGRKDPDVDR